MSLFRWVRDLLFNRDYFWQLIAMVLVGETVLSFAIIKFVPCTCGGRGSLFAPALCRVVSGLWPPSSACPDI
jgi:hypothetical protein